MAFPWPVEVLPLKPVACGAIVWRMHGALSVTVVIKAAFGLIHEHEARLIAPTDLGRADRHASASNGVEEIFEMAPYLPSAGVIVSGHACAPAGGAAASSAARVILFRDDATLLDKTLHIFGDRDATPAGRPLPFGRMPLVWERTRAYGGPGIDDNPVGVGSPHGSRALPNIVDAVDPRRPAGFGPIGARWPARARLLGGAEPPALDREVVDIPEGFDWRWFHAAPADQQVDFLTGDEWIALDGMHPTQPRVQSRLPHVRAAARWYQETSEGPTAAQSIELGADLLTIDADRQTCWVFWRGHFAIESLDQLPWIRVQAGVELPGYPIHWPEIAPPPPPVEEPRRSSVPMPAPAFADDDRTAMVDLEALAARAHRPIAPFALAEPGARAQPAPAGIPGAPSSWVTPFAAPTPRAEEREIDTEQSTARSDEPDDGDDPSARTSRLRIRDLQRPIAPFALAAPGPRDEAPRAAIPGAPWSAAPVVPAPAPFDPSVTHQELPATLVNSEAAPAPAPPRAAPAPVAIHDREDDEPFDPMARTTAMRVQLSAQPLAPFALTPVGPRADPPALAAIPGAPWARPQASPASVEPMVAAPIVAAPMVAPQTVSAPTIAAPTVAAPMVAAPMVAAPMVAPPTDTIVEAPASALRTRVLARLASGESFDDQDLSRGDLRDLDFHGRSLIRCNLRGSTLTGCNFDGARLEGAQLGEADLTGASLVGAELARADLSKATVAQARFDRARLTDTKLASVEGQGASFHAATGQRTSFARGAWDGAVFDAIDITGADFTGARLHGASFRSAAILEVRFAEAAGEGVIFDDARLPDARAKGAGFPRGSFRGVDAQRSAWGKARLDGARFDGGNLRGANLAAASCIGAGFADADLSDAVLQEAAVEGASFASANLRNARMDRAHGGGGDRGAAALDGADLRNARLPGASFAGAALRKVRADQAAFEGASFARSDLTEASLRGAALVRANLARSILRGADLRDANLDGANVHESVRDGAKMTGASVQGLRDEPEPEG